MITIECKQKSTSTVLQDIVYNVKIQIQQKIFYLVPSVLILFLKSLWQQKQYSNLLSGFSTSTDQGFTRKSKRSHKERIGTLNIYFTGSYKYHNLSTLNQICISMYHLLEDTRHYSDKSYMRVSRDCAFVLHLMNNYFYKKSTQ